MARRVRNFYVVDIAILIILGETKQDVTSDKIKSKDSANMASGTDFYWGLVLGVYFTFQIKMMLEVINEFDAKACPKCSVSVGPEE